MAKLPLSSHPFFVALEEDSLPLGLSVDDSSRKRSLLNGLSLVGIVFLVLLGSLAYYQGGVILATVDFFVAVFLLGLLHLLRVKGCLNLCIYSSISIIFILFMYLFINGGMAGNAFLWSFTFPLITFFLLGTRKGFFVSIIYYVFCLVVLLLDLNTPIAINLYNKAFALRFLPAFAVVILLAFIYELFRENSQKALMKVNEHLEREVIKRTAELQKEVIQKTKAQREAIRAKEGWERTFDAVPDEITILDSEYRIVRANIALAKAVNIPIAELVNTKCYESLDGTLEPPSYCPHTKLLEDRTTQQIDFFDKYTQRYLSVTVSPLYDGQGIFLGSVRVARDITEQRNAQIERDNIREQLRKAEKMEAIGLMAGGVAHDLNNILSGVVSYPEMLLLKLPKHDEYYDHLTFIYDAGMRAAAVVEDLLTVARGVATVRETSSLNNLINEYFVSIDFKNKLSVHPQVNILLELEHKLWTIRCSPVHIQKLLMNLVINAFEAIDSKGNIVISTHNKIVEFHNTAAHLSVGEYVVLTIRDDGTGIAPHDLEKIFEPFYTKKIMGRSGTGLGLAVVWNIANDHKATVNVESDSSGTTFTICFPALSGGKVSAEKDVDIASLFGAGSILVVDDDQTQRKISSQMLEQLGYTVVSVSSGESAIDFFQNNSVDLVLLDMFMEPGMSGYQTYRRIIKINPTQKAIVVSGFSESEEVKATLKLGAGSFVKKPYSMSQIGEAVKYELSGS